ncbi:tRNA lysidine(34) synthetase TilS [Acholeplasma sp. OttesenSCG-928-E16]|nr:tRNA lysidine(34) synthetase TilS [Acholeplasma sp. OttesenSCG-928-E16]
MKELSKYLIKELNIPLKSTLILSISGGVDSMVLLNLMTSFDYNLVVVHFNHQKRVDSINDKALVENYCQINNIPFEYFKLNIPKKNFQEQARLERNHYLELTARKYNTKYIFTAHHLDDLLETILMKLSRGSNLYGYAGMQPITKSNSLLYIKPFLYYSKEQIYSYAINNNIQYLEDSTNKEDSYTRNRFRHHIIPALKLENPNILDKTITYSIQLNDAFSFIRNTSKKHLSSTGKYDLKSFLSLDSAIQNDLLSQVLEHKNIEPTFKLLQKIKEIISNNKPNASYKLKGKYYFIKSYNTFYIGELNPLSPFIKNVEFENKICVSNQSFTFFNKKGDLLQEAIIICYNELSFPLKIRSRIDGDVLEFEYGRKKLKDFLIDKKIPKNERDNLIIISDSNNRIIFIPNLYTNKTLGTKNEMYLIMEDSNA